MYTGKKKSINKEICRNVKDSLALRILMSCIESPKSVKDICDDLYGLKKRSEDQPRTRAIAVAELMCKTKPIILFKKKYKLPPFTSHYSAVFSNAVVKFLFPGLDKDSAFILQQVLNSKSFRESFKEGAIGTDKYHIKVNKIRKSLPMLLAEYLYWNLHRERVFPEQSLLSLSPEKQIKVILESESNNLRMGEAESMRSFLGRISKSRIDKLMAYFKNYLGMRKIGEMEKRFFLKNNGSHKVPEDSLIYRPF